MTKAAAAQEEGVAVPSTPTRNDLRSKILSQQRGSKIIALEDGVEIEVRQSLVGEMLDGIKEQDVKLRMLNMMILACYVPGTNERIFEEGDRDALAQMPAGGYWQKLMDSLNSMVLPAQIAEAEKNSQTTGSTSSST